MSDNYSWGSAGAQLSGSNAFPSGMQANIVDVVYPVGSIYMSTSSTSPATLFGTGTWVQLKDRFLLGAGDTYTNDTTGGAASQSYTPGGSVGDHTLTTTEIPSHSHGLNSHTHSVGAHSHGLNSHTHSVGAHSHGLNSHTHTYTKATGTAGNNGNTASGGGNLKDYTAYALIIGDSNYVDYFEINTGTTWNYNASATVSTTGARGGGHAYATKLQGSIAHTHGLNNHSHTVNTASDNTGGASGSTENSTAFNTGAASGSTANSTAFDSGAASGDTATTGSGGAHGHGFTGTEATINTMPPYLVVYMWQRTA